MGAGPRKRGYKDVSLRRSSEKPPSQTPGSTCILREFHQGLLRETQMTNKHFFLKENSISRVTLETDIEAAIRFPEENFLGKNVLPFLDGVLSPRGWPLWI